jgi:hypothetical protein
MAVVMTDNQYASMPGVTPMGRPGMMAPPRMMAAPAMMAPQMSPAFISPQMSPTLMAPPVMVTRPGAAVPALPVGVYGEDAKKAILRNLPPGSYFAEDKGKGRDDGKYHGECTCTVM